MNICIIFSRANKKQFDKLKLFRNIFCYIFNFHENIIYYSYIILSRADFQLAKIKNLQLIIYKTRTFFYRIRIYF